MNNFNCLRIDINKIEVCHEHFSRISSQIKKHFNLSFGYLKVFSDNRYIFLMDDLDCAKEFVTTVTKSSIFCERNVTNYEDGDFNFTLWPDNPFSYASSLHFKYKLWNGVTISNVSKDECELFWFSCDEYQNNWQDFFIRNKKLLYDYIKFFELNKRHIPVDFKNNKNSNLVFSEGFDTKLPESEFISETKKARELKNSLFNYNLKLINENIKLTKREKELFSIIGDGYSVKYAASRLGISTKTAEQHVNNLKHKTGFHFKSEVIDFYRFCNK